MNSPGLQMIDWINILLHMRPDVGYTQEVGSRQGE